MDIGFVTSLVSIPLVGALGTAAWRIQATITARKQSEIDQLKTEIESVRTIHAEQMTLQKEKTELTNDQMDTLIRKRTQEMTEKIEIEFISKVRQWRQYAIVGITASAGLAIFVLGLLFSMIPRTAADDAVMTLVNDENVKNEITRFGLHNDSVAGTVLFAHGPTFMWGTIIGASILAIAFVLMAVNSFFKSKPEVSISSETNSDESSTDEDKNETSN